MDLKQRMDTLDESLSIKYDKNDVHIIKEEFQEYITQQLKNYQTTIEADVDKKDLNASIEKLYKYQQEAKKQFEKMDAENNAIKNNINSRVTIKDFNQLKAEMAHLATK